MLLRRQPAAVRRTIVRRLVIDARLAVLHVARLAGGHLAGAHTLADSLLLVISPLVDGREGRVLRMPAVRRGEVRPVRMRHLHMLLLLRGRRHMVLMLVAGLLRARTSLYPAVTTIEARVIVDHRVVHVDVLDVRVTDHCPIHIHDRRVIREVTAIPPPAVEAGAAIPEAVVDAAVEADMRPPVAGVEDEGATSPAPVAGRPKHADRRRLHPHTGNPVVPLRTIRPVAGIPEIAIARADRLGIHRQCGRPETDRDKDAGERRKRRQAKCCCNNQFPYRAEFHSLPLHVSLPRRGDCLALNRRWYQHWLPREVLLKSSIPGESRRARTHSRCTYRRQLCRSIEPKR